jgi:hypothetical protein
MQYDHDNNVKASQGRANPHTAAVNKGIKLADVRKLDLDGTFCRCPFLHAVAYLTGSPASAEEIFELLMIVMHMNSTEPSQIT